ncbi:MAG TPA: DNA recombination protein RmuC [Candidatus Saccharimonadales bacterium]|nr:DNA recombination protein RmuC [Candidatus Saccharimonadales bacterium]
MEVVIIVLGVIIAALLLLMLNRRDSGSSSTVLIKEDLKELNSSVNQLKEGLQNQITDRLDKNQTMMRDSMVKQFSASSKLITEVTEKLTKLDETNKRVVDVAAELKTLQNVLQNPKQRGVLGEYYLESVMKNTLPPDRYQMQYKFKGGDLVDAVIILDKGKLLPIDSKYSLENYNRLVEEEDPVEKEKLTRLFKSDLKNRIDETAKYIRPREGTMDFAFMFIPSEAIYYELLITKVGRTGTNARDLIEYAFRDKKVIIVSPTSFMAYLQTVMQGLRSLQIEEQAKEISIRVGELAKHLSGHEQLMQRMGSSLGATVGHYNRAHQELKKVDKDVIKITGESVKVEPLLLDRPEDEEAS